MTTTRRRITIREVGEVTVVEFRDEKLIEDLQIEEIGTELFALVDEEKEKKILLNFSAVDLLCGAFLGKLITLEKKIREREGKLKLCHIQPRVYKDFATTRLNRLFDIKDNEADALAAF